MFFTKRKHPATWRTPEFSPEPRRLQQTSRARHQPLSHSTQPGVANDHYRTPCRRRNNDHQSGPRLFEQLLRLSWHEHNEVLPKTSGSCLAGRRGNALWLIRLRAYVPVAVGYLSRRHEHRAYTPAAQTFGKIQRQESRRLFVCHRMGGFVGGQQVALTREKQPPSRPGPLPLPLRGSALAPSRRRTLRPRYSEEWVGNDARSNERHIDKRKRTKGRRVSERASTRAGEHSKARCWVSQRVNGMYKTSNYKGMLQHAQVHSSPWP